MASISQKTDTSQTLTLDTSVLLTQIKHLKEIILKKNIEIGQKNKIISFYRENIFKDNQCFCLIVMLFAEIQRLKNKIQAIESQDHAQCPHITNENLKKQLKEFRESSDLPNLFLLKELQKCVIRLFQCYKPVGKKEDKENQLHCSSISSTKTYQNSSFINPSRQEKIPSSTSLAESIYLNSEISKDSQNQQEYFPLYTPIKNHQCHLVTFGKISEEKDLDLSTDLLTSQGNSSFDSEPMSKQTVSTHKNLSNNSLAFLSHRRKVSLATQPQHLIQKT